MAPEVRTFPRFLKARRSQVMLTHARQTKAGRVPARLGRAVSTHRAPEGARQWAQRGAAVQCHACSGRAWRGAAWPSKHTAAYGPLQFAWPGTARHGEARRGEARPSKHTAAYGPLQFARQSGAQRVIAGQGMANTQRLPGRCSLLKSDRNGFAWLCCAGRGTIIRLITGQLYEKRT